MPRGARRGDEPAQERAKAEKGPAARPPGTATAATAGGEPDENRTDDDHGGVSEAEVSRKRTDEAAATAPPLERRRYQDLRGDSWDGRPSVTVSESSAGESPRPH